MTLLQAYMYMYFSDQIQLISLNDRNNHNLRNAEHFILLVYLNFLFGK